MSAQPLQNRNFLGLLGANTILGVAMPMLIILGGLAGLMLAPSTALATLPPSLQMLAGLIATGPFSLFMGRFGRKAGFALGGVIAILGGILGVWALFSSSFILLCVAHMVMGAATACFQYFRFAAAEVVSDDWQPVAISFMLTSGLIAALVGPQIFIMAKDAFAPIPLAGAYAAISVTALIGLVPLMFVRMAPVTQSTKSAKQSRQSALAALRHKPVQSAVIIGAVSQAIMVLLMAPTPIAMIGCGLDENTAGDVIRWHVVAMFAPSFFTGFIVKKFGTRPVIVCGLVLLLAAAGVAASGLTEVYFYLSLILLGVGWNFGFIGATNMLAQAVPAEDRAVVQGLNDTIIALASTLCAFASGAIVAGFGWTILALCAMPVIVLSGFALRPKAA